MAVIEINWQPSPRDLRVFAVVQLVVASIGAWLLHRRWGWDSAAAGLVSASLVGLVTGLIKPQVLRPLYIAWMVAAFPLGWVMSHVMLAVVYYGVLTPIGFALKFGGHDPLKLKPQPDATTYWISRPPSPKPKQYFRQF